MLVPNIILPIPVHWNLTEEQIFKIYEVEKIQSQKLRSVENSTQRKDLYGIVYEEYFQKLPFHPQFTIKNDTVKQQNRVAYQWNQIKPFTNRSSVFVEVGAGDCSFSIAVAQHFKNVIALEVSAEIVKNIDFPENVRCVIFDGFNIPLAENSVDLVYSNQLMEHLHPDDAEEQLKSIFKILKKGGKYTCITPNRFTGPHDISRFYGDTLEGFHLKEYSSTDLDVIFKKVGFSKVTAHTVIKNRYIKIPFMFIRLLEGVLAKCSKAQRMKLLKIKPLAIIFNSFITAIK